MSRDQRKIRAQRWLSFGSAALVAIALGSCSEAPTGVTGAPPKPQGMVVCDDPYGNCSTGTINPYDSHLSTNITVQLTTTVHSDVAFEDPVTGQTVTDLTLDTPAEHLAVSSGYSDTGEPIVVTTSQDPGDSNGPIADQVTTMKLVGNNILSTNAYGQTVTSDQPIDVGPTNPLDLLGDMTGASVTDNIVVDVSGDNSPDPVGNRVSNDSRRMSLTFSRLTDARSSDVKPVIQLLSAGRLAITAVSKESPADAEIKHVRKFHKTNDGAKWILDEISTESEDVDQHRKLRHVTVMTFKDVRWFENKEKDKARRKQRPTNAVVPLPTTMSGVAPARSLTAATIRGPSFLVACGDECGGGGSPPGGSTGSWDAGSEIGGCTQYGVYVPFPSPYPSPDGPDPRGSPPPFDNTAGAVHPDGTNIVLQHGFFSSAGTWCDMEQFLRNNVRVGYEMRFSLHSWQQSYEEQAADLTTRVNNSRAGNTGFIFIGHSNGGIVSRQLAHTAQDGSIVRGIITIDTPHQGAPLAAIPSQAVSYMLAPIIGVAGCRLVGHQICDMIGGAPAAALASLLVPFALNSGSPVIREMNPHDGFWSAFNAVPESFPRAGIQSKSWDKWSGWRMWGDSRCSPLVYCGGRATAKFVDQRYHFAIKCAVVGGIAGLFWHPSWVVAAGCAKLAAQLKASDGVYKRLTVGGDSGDGIVPLNSQYYPNANRQYQIPDGDSHVGVLRGVDKSGPQVLAALSDVFRVPLR